MTIDNDSMLFNGDHDNYYNNNYKSITGRNLDLLPSRYISVYAQGKQKSSGDGSYLQQWAQQFCYLHPCELHNYAYCLSCGGQFDASMAAFRVSATLYTTTFCRFSMYNLTE